MSLIKKVNQERKAIIMSEDMSEMIQKMSEMLKNNEIPDNVKSIINNLSNQSNFDSSSKNNTGDLSQKSTNKYNQENSNKSFQNNSNTFTQENSRNFNDSVGQENDNFDIPNIDLGTMLKMKSIIDSMNKQQNDPRANLLRSLKPYLKPSRKEKVDQYIKLFSMGKVFEVLNPLGGEKKNDV